MSEDLAAAIALLDQYNVTHALSIPVPAVPPLPSAVGWGVIFGFGLFFTAFTMAFTYWEEKHGRKMSSEMFNTAGREVGIGLTAAVIVSQWTWAATLLMSSNMGWRVGISGPFWYASGATIQILLFAVLAIQVKRRASHMHTFMEIIYARFGTLPHCIMVVFALLANLIVTSMLILGGSATIEDLTGVPTLWSSFFIPILCCWFYTMYGGLRATFVASYFHTTVIFFMLLVFTFTVYASPGDDSGLYGSPSKVYFGLEQASNLAYEDATRNECEWLGTCTKGQEKQFSALSAILQNAGECWDGNTRTEVFCTYQKLPADEYCCSEDAVKQLPPDGLYCRKDGTNCIDTGSQSHFKSEECAAGQMCKTSFLTMSSWSGLMFGITNIVGNFGTVFVDQSYWQSAVAAKPKSAVFGFLVGGMVWFAVPFCMATTNGLAGRAITAHPDLGPMYITAGASGSGLTPARVLSHVMGSSGATILLFQLFMAITSTGSAEIIAVSSILTYDLYYTYVNPELKFAREKLRQIFSDAVGGMDEEGKMWQVARLQELLDTLAEKGFFETGFTTEESSKFIAAVNGYTTATDEIEIRDLYNALNMAVSANSVEGPVLLKVSKMFTLVFALLMGFLAACLDVIGFQLGFVYMSMGVLIGSAVGPASLSILLEKANGFWIAGAALGGFVLGVFSWVMQAKNEYGDTTIEYLGKDMPLVIGNVVAIMSGLTIAGLGSIIFPDKEFKWHMLNDRIPLVDDIEPPKDADETGDKLEIQVKIAEGASVLLTVVLILLWPLPMHYGVGVFGEGRFTVWVAVEMLWAIIGAVVIVGLPAYETWVDIKKQKEKFARSGREVTKLNNGASLQLDFKPTHLAGRGAMSSGAQGGDAYKMEC